MGLEVLVWEDLAWHRQIQVILCICRSVWQNGMSNARLSAQPTNVPQQPLAFHLEALWTVAALSSSVIYGAAEPNSFLQTPCRRPKRFCGRICP